jgi:hypothetical protein
MKERSMKRTHNPTVVESMTVHPGDVIAIPGDETKSVTITRINQVAFDKFQLTVNGVGGADSAESVLDLDAGGYDRIVEPEPDLSTGTPRRRLVVDMANVDLKINDVLSVPVFGKGRITDIVCIRPDRYQVRVQVKFVAAFDIDIVVNS